MAVERFEQHRDLLTGVAYRIPSTLADAEDVVQEAWLRWSGVETSKVEDDRTYLVRVATRLSIDRLRRVRALTRSWFKNSTVRRTVISVVWLAPPLMGRKPYDA